MQDDLGIIRYGFQLRNDYERIIIFLIKGTYMYIWSGGREGRTSGSTE